MDKHKKELIVDGSTQSAIEIGGLVKEGLAAGMEDLCCSIEQATEAVADAAINLSIKDDV